MYKIAINLFDDKQNQNHTLMSHIYSIDILSVNEVSFDVRIFINFDKR